MKRFLKAIIQAGVRPEMSVREARFIKACNIVAIVTVVWVLLVIPTVFPFRPAVRNVVIAGAACGLGLCLVPVLNGYGLYRTAQMYAATISMCTLTFNALQFGHAAWNHLLLLAGILVSFYYVESLYVLIWITVFGLCLFAGVEGWYASGRQGLLEGIAPDQFFASVKNTSVYSLVALTIGFAYYNRALLISTQRALDRESARSEALLLNILPKPIAERLKSSPQLIADRIPEVSIMFADLVGFTEMSRKMDAGRVVGMLNEIFLGFDRAAKRLGLEKIKTIPAKYIDDMAKARADGYVYGVIWYDDIFLRSERHKSKFCFIVQPVKRGDSPTTVSYGLCQYWNCADDECEKHKTDYDAEVESISHRLARPETSK
jgi:adenylate cyclase